MYFSLTSPIILLTLCCSFAAGQANENLFQKEIACHGLPYGAIRFVSHLLAYYTMFILSRERRPITPWMKLTKTSPKFNYYLIGTKILGTIIAPIATMIHCHHTWITRQFATLAAMKLSLTISFALVAVINEELYALLYFPGAMVGLVGIFSIAASDMHNSGMKFVTGFFWDMAALTSFSLFAVGANVDKQKRGLRTATVVSILAWGALCIDWAWMIVANNGVARYPYDAFGWVKVL
ncbi:hypothetical protein ACMFMG_010704 [Clarireedia jacksonii]